MKEYYIKNMVCQRCIQAVQNELSKQGILAEEISLGFVKTSLPLTFILKAELASGLLELGFELLDDVKAENVEKIKKVIIEKIHHSGPLDIKMNWSSLIASACKQDYKQLSQLFSGVEGLTLEQYIIRQKVEKIKELLFYDEMNINEISYLLDYSSVQHLSAQFKKITGQTPSQFKAGKLRHSARKSLDKVS